MKSIALKLWLGMMALVAVVLLLLWLFQIVFLDRFYTNMRISEIKNDGYSIIRQMETDNGKVPGNSIDTFAYSNNSSVELLDRQGSVMYSTGTGGQMPMMRSSSIRVDAFNKALSGEEASFQLTHPRFGTKITYIGLPVKISGEIKGALLISLPLVPVSDTAAILKRQLMYITVILLASAVIMSFFLSKSFTEPIIKIIKVSSKMASGDFSARIELRNKDEIGRLAGTINYLGQELSKIEQLRKDLIANVSHELRTPLSLVRGYAETIRDVSGDKPEKREKQLGIIIEETERLSKIVDDMLDLSQMQAGYTSLDIDRFEIHHVLEGIIGRYNILSEKTGIHINLENSEEIIVEADEKKIQQVLYNLINNAFNHTGQGGNITLRTICADGSVRVEVSDTGEGIPKEAIDHIWDRFYKAGGPDGGKTAGTGLGLAIVKSILDAHGFGYGVVSSIGKGSTFWFELKTAE